MSDLDGVQIPFLEDLVHGLFPALFHDDEHALLAFGKQDLIRRHVRFALRNERHVDLDAAAASASGLAGGAGKPGGAHVLDADDVVGLEELKAGFQEKFFHERVADLDGGALRFRFFRQFGGGESRAVDAVFAGGGADVEDRVADARRLAALDLVDLHDAQAEGVHKTVGLVGLVVIDVAADRRDAHAVAVMGDAADHAVNELLDLPGIRAAETQRVHVDDGARAHREDVS